MDTAAFRKKINSPFFKLFLLQKLPLAFIAGVGIKKFDEMECVTSLKFRWLNQNPFKSMYFAAMQMAAELSTGLLLFQHLSSKTKFSMLLISVNATYEKKAIGRINFVCKQGVETKTFVGDVFNSEEGLSKSYFVKALNESDEEVATFEFVWSCKKKQGPDLNSRP